MSHPLDFCPSIPHAFFVRAQTDPQGEVYSQARIAAPDIASIRRDWRSTSHREAAARVRAIAGYLQTLGVFRGTSIAILSNTRPEWMEADLGILAVGGVSVSVYHSLTAEEVGYILFDSDAEIVFAENEEQVKKIFSLIEHGAKIPATEGRLGTHAKISIRKIITFEKTTSHPIVISYDEVIHSTAAFSDVEMKRLSRDDLAALVYTSGTTGPPKGVMQTHGNHLSNVRQVLECGLIGEGMSIMLFLPLAHSFAKLMGYMGFLASPTLCFPAISDRTHSKQDMDSVTRDIREADSQIVPVVPRILEKMQSGIFRKARGKNIKSAIVRLTLRCSALVMKKKPGEKLPLSMLVAFEGTAGVRAQIKKALFGKKFKYAVSGGAKLDPEVNKFFESLQIEVLEGYGLTETCVATNVNRVGMKKIGTVGKVLTPDIELKIAEDGEIVFRGPNITKGYYKRPEATKFSWDSDGWFHTGDLGSVDNEGYLSIVGRKKDLIVTSYGKKISPDVVEGALRTSPYISQAVVFGDDKPFCVAVITLDAEAVRKWAEDLGLDMAKSPDFSEKLRTLLDGELDRINEGLASFESVKKYFVAPEEFGIENGFLTPTLKIKKKIVFEKYQNQIEQLYKGER